MNRPPRSMLFVPGTRLDWFQKALSSEADAVVLDLEDSVPADAKDGAREAIAGLLANRVEPGCDCLVRVNAAGTPWFDADMAMVAEAPALGGVIIPKSADVRSLSAAASMLGTLGKGAHIAPIFPLLETAAGVLNAAAIATSAPGVRGLVFGAEDLAADIDLPVGDRSEALAVSRGLVVLAAAAAAIDAFDAPFMNLEDETALLRESCRARRLGFRGKLAIHPRQVAIINNAFTPTAEEVAQARRIVEAYQDAAARGVGAIKLDGRLVDAVHVSHARRLLRECDNGSTALA